MAVIVVIIIFSCTPFLHSLLTKGKAKHFGPPGRGSGSDRMDPKARHVHSTPREPNTP